jgi:hypothetical protein
MYPHAERRAAERVKGRYKMRVTILACEAEPRVVNRSFLTFTRNVSVGGVLCCFRSRVPVGAKLQVAIFGGEPDVEFRHVGRLVWLSEIPGCRRFTAGIYFTEPERNVLLAWRHWVSALVQAAHKPPRLGHRRRRHGPAHIYR